MSGRLYRSESDRILGGVCGGIAEVYDIDPALIRISLVLFTLMGGSGLLAYFIAWLIIPSESELEERESDAGKDIETGDDADEESESSDDDESEDEESFVCEECGREFDSQRGLSVHAGQKH